MKPSVSRLGARYSPAFLAAAHSGAVVMWRIRRDMPLRLDRLARSPEVHVAPRLRALDEARLEVGDLETGGREQRAHVAREMATAREPHLPRVEAVLELRGLLVGREA